MTSGPNESRYPRLVNAEPISEFVCPNGPAEALWTSADLPGIWLHQQGTSLASELSTIDPAWALLAQQQGGTAQPPVTTFRDLLFHAAPPVELLELCKLYAKSNLRAGADALPEPIATGLYVMSILLAWVRCGKSISTLPIEQVCDSASALRSRHWIDADTRRLLYELLRGVPFPPEA